jgi:hypothetical protein
MADNEPNLGQHDASSPGDVVERVTDKAAHLLHAPQIGMP